MLLMLRKVGAEVLLLVLHVGRMVLRRLPKVLLVRRLRVLSSASWVVAGRGSRAAVSS